jgi:hypothetical protein
VRAYYGRMDEPSKGPISLTTHLIKVQGRAAEIARSFGYRACGPEHLFLGMLHDGEWPVAALADLVDLEQAEAAVLAIVTGPGYRPPPPPRFPQPDGHVRAWGAEVVFELDDNYYGLEHALLWMLRHPETVPARALASLAGLDAIEAAVLAAKNAPPSPPADAVYLPEGMGIDHSLNRAIFESLPAETTYGLNTDESGRTWVDVFGPGKGDTHTREVLNRALATLGRPPLNG